MAERLKYQFNVDLIRDMAGHLRRAWPEFDSDRFTQLAVEDLDRLELKQRSDQISDALQQCLPVEFQEASRIISSALARDDLPGITGWATMPLNSYIGEKGLSDFDTAMMLLQEISPLWTSEFGVRYFLIHDQDRALVHMTRWAVDTDYRIRRLASEGCRPRLPWAMQLPNLMSDPEPILGILHSLRDDKEEYVRRSVANNLNDISKDHPDLVADITKCWLMGAPESRIRLLRHANRSLLKQGQKQTLENFGFFKPKDINVDFKIPTQRVYFGSALEFDLVLKSESTKPQALMIDFVLHHKKANGSLSPKVFKWKTMTLKVGQTLKTNKRHLIRAITTRTYYPGNHKVDVVINGDLVATGGFELVFNRG